MDCWAIAGDSFIHVDRCSINNKHTPLHTLRQAFKQGFPISPLAKAIHLGIYANKGDNPSVFVMNRKQRRLTQSTVRTTSGILFGGKSYTVDEALAVAVEQHKLNNYRDTETLYRLILARNPGHVQTLNNLGIMLHQRHDADIDEVILLYRRAIRSNPDDSFAFYNLGDALSSKGDMKEAEEAFLKALTLNPHSPRTLLSLAKIRKYTSADHSDILRIHTLLNTPALIPQGSESLLYFALGKMYDDCGLYDLAFEAYRQANEIRNVHVPFDPDRLKRRTNDIIEVFSKDFLAQDFAYASKSDQPLFIVGMPRSGTTLLASVLSNHRDIESAGEIITMIESAAHLPELLGTDLVTYPQAAIFMTPAVASKVIKDYEKRLRRGINSSTPYILDKHPINFWHLGLISMMFPKARILHCTRNPFDTCLSNYFQNFNDSYEYSFDLRHIGNYYSEYTRLMAHWREALPMPMLEINYEDTVTDLERTARQMLDFLGLDWDERCLAPHTNPRTMATASMWQVRQPVYKHALER
jgi:tetratricopeptide (TPR) repeat protein